MHNVQPILIDRGLQRVLRTEADCAMVVGDDLAPALMRLLIVAREHDDDIHIAVLDDGRKETLVARAVGASGDWRCFA